MKRNSLSLWAKTPIVVALAAVAATALAAAPGGKGAGATQGSEPKTVTTSSGLRYADLEVGSGAVVKSGMRVLVDYEGWLADGSKFDSSLDRREPFSFKVGAHEVIQGWEEGVTGMKVGGKRKLIIPPDLAYGEAGAGGGRIPPNATLTFEIKLLAAQ